VCHYTCEGPNHASLLSTVQLVVSLFSPFFCPCELSTCELYYSVYPGPSETVRGSSFVDVFVSYYSILPFVPL